MTGRFKNILITKPSSLGDIVLTLPALRALRMSFPEAKISWLIRPEFAQLIENHPDLDEIITFDRKLLGRAWFHSGAFGALMSLIRKLRRSQFDVIFDFQGLFRTACLAWLSGSKLRFGMANAREFATIFYTHKIPQSIEDIHMVDFYLKIIRAAGARDFGVEFVFPQNPKAEESVGRLLSSHGIQDNYAVLISGSAHRDKCWPSERFAQIADKISSQYNLSIVATGSASESSIVEKIKEKAKVPIANLAGKTSLSELVALLKRAKLAVSNDTGPGHIAAAVGVPLVLMFGRSNPVRLEPYKRKHCVMAIEPDSRGVTINNFDPKYDIKNITVEQVYQKIAKQLKSLRGSPG
ncbi:MAG: glycosyltransferase family 9 protein [Sedimentisphaerales bacterium]|nr:glycosyltransferase family 9 protein [Sedimentisphaerales bacterium]